MQLKAAAGGDCEQSAPRTIYGTANNDHGSFADPRTADPQGVNPPVNIPQPVDSYEFDFVPLMPRGDILTRPFAVALTGQHPPNRALCEALGQLASEKPLSDDPKILSKQIEWWSEKLHWKATIASKLHEVGEHDLAEPFDHCRTEASVRRCTQCGKQTVFWNRCDHNSCPCCAPRLAREKRESVTEWARYIGQPKHVVLTVRNTQEFSKEYVQQFKADFNRLRRTAFATKHRDEVDYCDIATRREHHRYSHPWLGGFYALEVTKERAGWHLHLHALVDSRFIDSFWLADVWASIRGQDIAIVKVKDARSGDYLGELLKYVVKGDEMARWSGKDIAILLRAFAGVRTFGVFGTLYKRRGEFQAWLDTVQTEPQTCECGCSHFDILSPKEAEWAELTAGGCPPPQPTHNATCSQRILPILKNMDAVSAFH